MKHKTFDPYWLGAVCVIGAGILAVCWVWSLAAAESRGYDRGKLNTQHDAAVFGAGRWELGYDGKAQFLWHSQKRGGVVFSFSSNSAQRSEEEAP